MSDDEKKFSLDELPDEGGQPAPKITPKKTIQKTADPRIENLKKLNTDSSRIEMMEQSWIFDVPVYSFYWVPWIAILGILEWSHYFASIQDELLEGLNNPWVLGADVIAALLNFATIFLRHPIILIVLVPVFFNFRKRSDYYFEVKFDGIDTVRKYIAHGSKDQLHRTHVRWDSIKEVKKVSIDDKEFLRLMSLDGHMADIIWYIDKEKKRAFKLLLSGMIVPRNPIRAFLDNEKELK